jgi:RimJ/RimL family protein N-acetyltransferase
MKLIIPTNAEHTLKTGRLTLEPIVVGHAEEMLSVLSEVELHQFIPSDPFELEQLQKRYKVWEQRISKEKDEIWLNWAARENKSGELIGHFQAGVRVDSDTYIAYIVNSKHQRQGYALEALVEVVSFLKSHMKLKNVKAWIDTRNIASTGLVERLGMKKVDFIKDADYFKGTSSDEYVYEMKFD